MMDRDVDRVLVFLLSCDRRKVEVGKAGGVPLTASKGTFGWGSRLGRGIGATPRTVSSSP